MIRYNEYRTINQEIENSIREAFEFAKKKEKDKNDYYLFLCNAAYLKDYAPEQYNPYVIDNNIDRFIDNDRNQFLTKYLQGNYPPPRSNTSDSQFNSLSRFNTSDSKESLAIEMMMYTHIWESKNHLKLLKKLLDLCLSKEYDWKVKMPDAGNGDSMQKFIREEIRDNFKSKNLSIASVIKNGYCSQLRNAFAHSDYSFELNDPMIILHNYKGKEHEVPSVTIDDWTKYFCYSFLLNYHLQNCYYTERENISEEPIEVFLRDMKGNKEKGIIKYDKERNSFSYISTEK